MIEPEARVDQTLADTLLTVKCSSRLLGFSRNPIV